MLLPFTTIFLVNEPVIGTLIHTFSILFHGFQGLFDVEGVLSATLVLVCCWFLPVLLTSSAGFNEVEQRDLACQGALAWSFFWSSFHPCFNMFQHVSTCLMAMNFVEPQEGRHWMCRSWLDCWKSPSLHSTASCSTSPEIHCAMTTCRWPQLQRCTCHHLLYPY